MLYFFSWAHFNFMHLLWTVKFFCICIWNQLGVAPGSMIGRLAARRYFIAGQYKSCISPLWSRAPGVCSVFGMQSQFGMSVFLIHEASWVRCILNCRETDWIVYVLLETRVFLYLAWNSCLFVSYLKLVSFCVLLETRVNITTRFVSRPTSTQEDKIGHYEVIFNSFPAREFMLLMQFLAQRVWQTGYAGHNCSFPGTWHVLSMQKRS